MTSTTVSARRRPAGPGPGPALLGFVLLLALLFAGSYALGRLVGPPAPGGARPAGDDMPGMHAAGPVHPGTPGVRR
ncbi:hypothetical protein [Kitasatospora sp. NPDC050543]|uniref:hypothetical protein n=1 Tax=Kitasatospora sp. NPDC050543 TaxID=3364054 RepID=UPI0037AEEE67